MRYHYLWCLKVPKSVLRRRLLGVHLAGRVGGGIAAPHPSQTRAGAIDALGSSPDRFAQEFCHERVNVTGGRGSRLRITAIRSQFRHLRRLRRASHFRQMRTTW